MRLKKFRTSDSEERTVNFPEKITFKNSADVMEVAESCLLTRNVFSIKLIERENPLKHPIRLL